LDLTFLTASIGSDASTTDPIVLILRLVDASGVRAVNDVDSFPRDRPNSGG